jgi:hypothetical protein
MAETRVAQVIDALIARLGGTAGFRLNGDSNSAADLVTVFDGAEIRSTDDSIDQVLLVIGWAGDNPDETEPAATIALSSGPIAATNRPRDEITSISCKVMSHRASTQKEARDAGLAALTAVAKVLRSDPSLGINTSDTIGAYAPWLGSLLAR